MLNFLNTIPGIILGIGAVAGTVIGGMLFFAGVFDTKKKEREKDVDGQEDRLIALLKETEVELNKKLTKQKDEHDETVRVLTKKIDDLTKKVDDLEKENGTLVEVLQGRDKKTQEFYAKAFEAMEIAKGTHEIVVQMSKTKTELMTALVDKVKNGVIINNQPPAKQ